MSTRGSGKGSPVVSKKRLSKKEPVEEKEEEVQAPAEPGGANQDTVEDLVARAAAMQVDDSDEAMSDGSQTIFNPWQYTDLNASSTTDTETADSNATSDEGKGDMEADRKGLLRRLREAVGVDLTKISIPVYYNEPTSFLHRMAEACQYYELLNKAAKEKDPVMRLLYVTVFAIVPYSSAERTTKPFNPILGETFEWTTPDARFVAEQVSHHPPICAGHMETKNWTFLQYKEVKASFTGNTVVAPPCGGTWVTLKNTNDQYKWDGIHSAVHNILVGSVWVDHYGNFKVTNQTEGRKEYASVTFTQCGWFSRGWHHVQAHVFDEKGVEQWVIEGHWHDKLYIRKPQYSFKDEAHNTLVWEKDKRPAKDKHASFKGFSAHGQEINELTPLRHSTLLASDSRFRPDCRSLAKLNFSKAGKYKTQLEEMQRAEAKRRKAGEGEEWTQRWFKPVPKDDGSTHWEFNGKYWVEREKRLATKNVVDPVTPSTKDF